jgi:alpha-amylase
VPEVCIGFDIHQHVRLARNLSHSHRKNPKGMDSFFFDPQNKEILNRVSDRCYQPAGEILLEKLDSGFSCALSLSGTVVEQWERWRPDILSLFTQISSHTNTDLIGQPYYHSIASCFSDLSEFEDQVQMHSDLMHDLFGSRPRIFVNTGLSLNNTIASCIYRMGFSGVISEGVDRVLGTRSPNYLYSCQNVPMLLRNVRMSDDITIRFADEKWDHYPLSADTYSSWLASSSGDIITIFVNFETFGEHLSKKTGILDFLSWLPDETERKGVQTILPSTAVSTYTPVQPIDLYHMISWADELKDISAWKGNIWQKSAIFEIQKAEAYSFDKKIWRYLQSGDNFLSMSSKFRPGGQKSTETGEENPEEIFFHYMKIVAEFERQNIRLFRKKKAGMTLRCVNPDEAFYFSSPAGSVGFIAYSIDHFHYLLDIVPSDSIVYHQERGDFERWIREVLKDETLAKKIAGVWDRSELLTLIHDRKEMLWKNIR